MKISEIHINPKNPRFIRNGQFDKLLESLEKFPKMMELRPIIVDENNVIQGGNMRYRALKKLGFKEIPDSWVKKGKDLTPDEWREFVVKDNLAYGEWDYDLLSAEYDISELQDWGMEIPEMMEADSKEVEDDHYEIPERIETDIQPGDLITIGPHRILCGDATRQEDYTKLMDGRKADLVVTDPPYNVDYGQGNKIINDNVSDSKFYKLLFDFYRQMLENLKPGRGYYIFHSDTEGYNFRKALIDNGVRPRQHLVWVKNTLVLGRHDYHWRHEPILYGWKPGAAHYFTSDRTNTTVIDDKIDLKKLNKAELLAMLQEILSDKTPTTVVYHDKPMANDLHPTMKPVPLLGYFIRNSSKPGETVLDPFCGSGSTIVAAHQLKRRCYAIDLDPVYCEIMIDRLLRFEPGIKVSRNGQSHKKPAKETVAA